jgi:hypothetical protein
MVWELEGPGPIFNNSNMEVVMGYMRCPPNRAKRCTAERPVWIRSFLVAEGEGKNNHLQAKKSSPLETEPAAWLGSIAFFVKWSDRMKFVLE